MHEYPELYNRPRACNYVAGYRACVTLGMWATLVEELSSIIVRPIMDITWVDIGDVIGHVDSA
jgi:hypothetical protein